MVDPNQIVHRFTFVVPIAFLISIVIFFLLDKFIGGAFLLGSVILLIMWIVYYYKIKKNDPVGATKSIGVLFILMGVVALILGIIGTIFGKNLNRALYLIVWGILLIIFGVYKIKKGDKLE